MSRPIYGISTRPEVSCDCIADPPPTVALLKLLAIIQGFRTAVQRFYDQTYGVAPVVANMRMSAVVSTPVLVRLRWIELNPGVVFNKNNLAHLDGIKFIYNLINRDWHTDPLFSRAILSDP